MLSSWAGLGGCQVIGALRDIEVGPLGDGGLLSFILARCPVTVGLARKLLAGARCVRLRASGLLRRLSPLICLDVLCRDVIE